MRAVEISAPGGPEVLVAVERPTPEIGAGEVLIRVSAAGVNRPDVFQRMGVYPPPPGASDLPGLEVAGTVAAVADDVTGLAVGDRVTALVTGGGYAEYAIAPAATCLPIPAGLDAVAAAAIPETFFTVWSTVFDRARLQPGERFLVHGGASGIGTTAIQLARAFGAEVFTTVGSADKAEVCRALGADHVILHRDQDFVEVIRRVTEREGVDVILDMVGGDYIARNLEILAVEGRHVSIAFLHGSRVELDLMRVMLKRQTLTGATLRPRSIAFKARIAAALHAKVWPLLERGEVAPRVHATFPLEAARDAHALMESSGHIGKIVLEVA